MTKKAASKRSALNPRAESFESLFRLEKSPQHNDTGDDQSLLGREPVPRDSRAFWDQILAEAGTPTRTQEIPSQTARIVEPSEEFIESNHSSRASPAESDDVSQLSLEVTEALQRARSPTVVKRKDLSKHYGISLESLHSARSNRSNGQISELESSPRRSPMRDRIAAILGRQNGQVDGPAERRTAMPTSAESAMSDDLNDGLYGNRRDRRTISSAFSSNWITHNSNEAEAGSQRGESTSLPGEMEGELSLSPYSPGPSPFSPLSPPESGEAEHTPDSLNHVSRPTPNLGLLSQPPRRRNRPYRRRSQSYSYVISEDSQRSSLPQHDGLGASPANHDGRSSPSRLGNVSDTSPRHIAGETLDEPLQPPRFPFASTHSTPSPPLVGIPYRTRPSTQSPASYLNPVHISSYQSLRSLSNQSTHSHFTPSPVSTTPLLPQYHQSHPIRPSFSLPPPFSATPRNVSLHQALPTFDASSITPSQHRLSSGQAQGSGRLETPPQMDGSIPQTPQTLSSPHSFSHTNPPITIYNDALPATQQPQTPADLHRRNNLNRFASANPFSAPPRMSFAHLPTWAQPAAFVNAPPRTPTRNSDHHEHSEQGRSNWNSSVRRQEAIARTARRAGDVPPAQSPRAGNSHPPETNAIATRLGYDNPHRIRAANARDSENEGSVTPEERAWRRRRADMMGMGSEEIERVRGGLG